MTMILRCSKYGKAFYLESLNRLLFIQPIFFSLSSCSWRHVSHSMITYCPFVCHQPIWRSCLLALIVQWLDGGRRKTRTVSLLLLNRCHKKLPRAMKSSFVSSHWQEFNFRLNSFPSPLFLSLCLLFRICFLFSRQETPENVDEQTHICVNVCRGFEGSKHFSTPSHVCFRNEDDTGDVLLWDSKRKRENGRRRFTSMSIRELVCHQRWQRQLKLWSAFFIVHSETSG